MEELLDAGDAVVARSNHEYGRVAENTPIGIATTTIRVRASRSIATVIGSFSTIFRVTARPSTNEVPKSSETNRSSQRRYWTCSG